MAFHARKSARALVLARRTDRHFVLSMIFSMSLVGGLCVLFALPAVGMEAGPPVATVQQEGARHAGPSAYHAMCVRDPVLCKEDVRAADGVAGPPATLTPAAWSLLNRVNGHVNAAIAPADDYEVYGASDYWTVGATLGDCEDYMIAKKKALIAAGWSADQLLYAVVVGRQTPYHAVLVVRTDRGDFVLDNLTDRVLPWDVSGYQFVIRQSAADPSRWVRVVAPPRPRDGVRIASG